MKIHLARNNVQAGPYTLDELNRMLASGEVIASDLMWHSGMSEWRTVGEMTANQGYYNPPIAPQTQAPQAPQSQNSQTPTSFGDNVDFRKQDENRRLTVAELYGQKPTQNQPDTNPQKSEPQPPQANQGEWQGRHATQGYNEQTGEQVLASVGSRFLATIINGLLVFLAFFPFLQQFVALNPDPVKMNAGGMSARIAYAQELSAKIDGSSAMLSLLFILALIFVQSSLIIKNGQSLGKLMAGIRIVDAKTRQKPSAGALLGVRGVVLVAIYWLSSMFGINWLLLAVNYLMASFGKDKQGWHDKLAGTVVVKNKKVDKK